jgi:asparagine synthase (glutamine-hydrolysing)
MCGIAGLLDPTCQMTQEQLSDTVIRMTRTLHRRGPDDEGTWEGIPAGVALGHRRLAIVDLSSEGHQPMHSACGRFVLVFNGEIYNFRALQQVLVSLGHCFRGTSDTEVMLAAFSQWGVEAALKQFVGMFAFGLWDKQERVLYLARDRIGEKPLYYGWMGQVFLFGSELKALRDYPSWAGTISRDALALLLSYGCIPSPHSIYQGIFKLLPGTFLTIPLAQAKPGVCPDPIPFWSVRQVAEAGCVAPFGGSDAEAVAYLDRLLREAVAHQMVADVPLGAFLSGGIDSSTIVALMQAQSHHPVRTFTIGFDDAAYNEAEDAGAIARHLGTDHTELYVTPDDALAVIPRLPTLYDEPFADASQIPTFLVSELARRHVTVSLSGDGGDELFGGYNRYYWSQRVWNQIRWMPGPLRQFAAKGIAGIAPQAWDRLFRAIDPVLPSSLKQRIPGEKMHKLANVLDVASPGDLYFRLASLWREPLPLVPGAGARMTIQMDRLPGPSRSLSGFIPYMMYMDLLSSLPNDMLVKIDRASMGVSLEVRVPFLDHRVVEFAWKLPLSMKIRNGQGKWIVRQVLDQYVPRSLFERPKSGFAVPIDRWLRRPLRDWAESLLDEQRLREEGFFDPYPIRQRWKEHLAGSHNWQYHLWSVLMFQAWLEEHS